VAAERWRDDGGGASSTRQQRRARDSSKVRGGGVVCSRVVLSLLLGPARWWLDDNGRKWPMIYDQAIDGWGGLRRGIMTGIKVGELNP
jgi:hypothetical protein